MVGEQEWAEALKMRKVIRASYLEIMKAVESADTKE
jgi:hypothetical protein